jgi:hypothetical protein
MKSLSINYIENDDLVAGFVRDNVLACRHVDQHMTSRVAIPWERRALSMKKAGTVLRDSQNLSWPLTSLQGNRDGFT